MTDEVQTIDEELQIQLHHFVNKGFILTTAPSLVMEEILVAVDDIMSQKVNPKQFNHRLAGQLQHEYELTFSDEAKELLEKVTNEWHRNHGSLGTPNKLIESWINLQQKHEFNPPHLHDGQLSWVIWANIPYNLKDELNQFPKARHHEASMFGFLWTDSLGNIKSKMLPVDKDWAGKMIVFPAAMRHFVNPFYTSDGLRISVAGNMG